MTKAHPETGEIVTVGESHPVWDAVAHATDRRAKLQAAADALKMITMPDLAKPVPALFVDLPWANDREAAQDEILSRLIAADTLEDATHDDALVKLDDLVGKSITVWGGTARPGTIDEGWGAYLSLDVTIGDAGDHKVVNTSSKEVCVVFWRAHCEKALPLRAHVTLKGNPTPGRNQPVGLIVEAPL